MIKEILESVETPAPVKDLRTFGLLVGVLMAVIGSWPFVYRGEPPRSWALAVATVLLTLGATWPSLLSPLHKVWMALGHILGWINTRILLSIIFYGMVTPIGFTRRLMRKDSLRKAFRADHETYRARKDRRPRGHMKYQF